MDGFDFSNVTPYCNGIDSNIKQTPFQSVNLAALDELINDDEDLFRTLDKYKSHMREIQLAKEKSKHDETSLNNNCFADNTRNLENGALLHESERKKVSLKLKSTSTLKQQTKELDEPFVDIEPQQQPQDSQKISSDGKQQTNEPTDQNEKRLSDASTAAAKKKSSHRKDDRKSRRSEDRKSGRNEDRNRSRRSEDHRSRRSEERKDEKRLKRSEERRSRRSEERRCRRSEERRPRRSEEKRSRRSEEKRQKRRHDRSPVSPAHYRDQYYSPSYRNRSVSPLPRGPRTPPNTPPPNTTEFDEFRGGNDDGVSMRHMPPYGAPVMPPQAHFIQFPAPNLQSNIPNYMNEYAAYMQPNRVPVQYNRPPPGMNAAPGMVPPTANEYFYHNASAHAQSHHLSNQVIPPNSYSNLIEVAPYGTQNSSNIDCIRKQTDNRRKPTIAVQKGNVLEIVPSAELQCDRNADATDPGKSDKILSIEKQQLQQALLRRKQERYKRKLERHKKRVDRIERKTFYLNELNRMSHLMTVGEDGKIVKASEILKQITFDGTSIKLANAKENDDIEDHEDIYIEPPIHSYDPQAIIGRSILSERNGSDKSSITK